MTVALQICAARRQPIQNEAQVREGMLLVGAIVRQVQASAGRVLSYDDMVSLGNEGLVDAMIRFEPARGVEFKAYASQRIRGAILDGMRREGRMPRRAWGRACESLEFDEELHSVDAGESPEETATRSQEAEAVLEAIEELAPEHAELVRRFYGEGESLQDISEELGYARGWGSKAMPAVHEKIRRRLNPHQANQARRTRPCEGAAVPRTEPNARPAGTVGPEHPSQDLDRDSLSRHQSWAKSLLGAFRGGRAQRKSLLGAFSGGEGPAKIAGGSLFGWGGASENRWREPFRVGRAQRKSLPGAFARGEGPAKIAAGSLFGWGGPSENRCWEPFRVGRGQRKSLLGAFSSGRAQRKSLPGALEASPRRFCAIAGPLRPSGQAEPRGARRTAFEPKRTVMTNVDLVNAILASRTNCTADFKRILPELQALPARKVRALNLDLSRTVSRVLAALPKILALKKEIERQVRDVEFGRLQEIETYAHVAQEAYLRSLSAAKTPDELRALGEEGDSMRALLRGDIATLVRRGQLDGSRFSACQGQPGYKTIATDLGLYTSVLRENWPRIGSKTCISEQELQRAQAIAEALLAFAGARELSPAAKAEAADVRDRAFTVLVDRFEEARRVVTYVRWHQGDAEEIAPSLYKGKVRGRKSQSRSTNGNVEQQPAVAPSATPAVSANAIPASAAASDPAPGNARVGSPNSNPFMH